MRFVIITGLSGAGKSQAMNAMEDIGYFCIDNLPPALIPKLADLCYDSQRISNVALVIDIRGGEFFNDFFNGLKYLKGANYPYEIIFLEASDAVLVRRYKETRRKHPLNNEGNILDGIKRERELLEEIKKNANIVIDTTMLTSAQLKEQLYDIYVENRKFSGLIVNVVSFGYKYGLPLDADLVFDVRFLPNPFYIEELKPLTGNDEAVRKYVMQNKEAVEFLEKLEDMIEFLIPFYIREGKSQLVIAIGCTGGRHRSITIANLLYDRLKKKDYNVYITHRDIEEG
ncbi:MAG: RNase adapter RapZ [Thermoanaerobacteraceae bacterium]|nr:RNase adapter RapZ [Thermoanaerobacteraceae bacterium]